MSRALSKGVWFVAGLLLGFVAGLIGSLMVPPFVMM